MLHAFIHEQLKLLPRNYYPKKVFFDHKNKFLDWQLNSALESFVSIKYYKTTVTNSNLVEMDAAAAPYPDTPSPKLCIVSTGGDGQTTTQLKKNWVAEWTVRNWDLLILYATGKTIDLVSKSWRCS